MSLNNNSGVSQSLRTNGRIMIENTFVAYFENTCIAYFEDTCIGYFENTFVYIEEKNPLHILIYQNMLPEMGKAADPADISVLFFPAGANIWHMHASCAI